VLAVHDVHSPNRGRVTVGRSIASPAAPVEPWWGTMENGINPSPAKHGPRSGISSSIASTRASSLRGRMPLRCTAVGERVLPEQCVQDPVEATALHRVDQHKHAPARRPDHVDLAESASQRTTWRGVAIAEVELERI
jgi:hypothetical protein